MQKVKMWLITLKLTGIRTFYTIQKKWNPCKNSLDVKTNLNIFVAISWLPPSISQLTYFTQGHTIAVFFLFFLILFFYMDT